MMSKTVWDVVNPDMMYRKKTMLTDAQAKAIRNTELVNAEPGYVFDPMNIHPAHNNQDNAKRRALHSLAQTDLVSDVNAYGDPDKSGGYLKVEGDVKAAYDEWYRQRGFRLV